MGGRGCPTAVAKGKTARNDSTFKYYLKCPGFVKDKKKLILDSRLCGNNAILSPPPPLVLFLPYPHQTSIKQNILWQQETLMYR